jgi:hypothetical protein
MDQKYIDFEKTIKRKVSFRFTPRFKETIEAPGIPARLLIEIAEKTIQALDWELTYKDDETLEARQQKEKWGAVYAIKVKVNHLGRMEVKSESTGNEMIDFGANSKRVKLFVFAFNDILSSYNPNTLADLQKQVEREDKMEDYVIPASLPQPINYKTPDKKIMWIGLLLYSVIIALPVSFLSTQGLYIIGIFELGIGWLGGLVFLQLLKMSNYANSDKLMIMNIVMVAVIFISEQIYHYMFFINETGYTYLNFFEFMGEKIAAGIEYKDTHLGPIALIIAWVIEIGLMYLLLRLFSTLKLLKYIVERVPKEVIEYATYHFAQGKDENQVKAELSKMGWSTELQHQMVWEALGGIVGAQKAGK